MCPSLKFATLLVFKLIQHDTQSEFCMNPCLSSWYRKKCAQKILRMLFSSLLTPVLYMRECAGCNLETAGLIVWLYQTYVIVRVLMALLICRWRDVKLRAFDDAKHRTYVDLKVSKNSPAFS